MANKDQFAGEEVFEGDELLVLADDGIGALLPRQPDIRAETVFRAGAFMAGLHDAAARAGNDHEACLGNLSAEVKGLLIFHPRGLRPRRPENRDLPMIRVRGEQLEGIPQLANRGLDYLDVARVFQVGEELERAFDDVGDVFLIITSSFIFDQLIDPPFQFGIHRRFFGSNHRGRILGGA